jgi:hypothetical protein
MPRGPKGEKRPADVIGNAVHVMRVATGEIEEKTAETLSRSHPSLFRQRYPCSARPFWCLE